MKRGRFQRRIHDWASWGAVFQSVEDFRPVVREVLEKERLWKEELSVSGLTPGTNAVFRAGNYVVKLFAPRESGLDTLADFETEQKRLRDARENGVRVPELYAASELEDRYLFRYLVMGYLPGQSAREILLGPDPARRDALIGSLRENLGRLHRPASGPQDCREAILKRAAENARWGAPFPEAIRRQVLALLEQAPMGAPVTVHGDLTADNVLALPDGELAFLDFADAREAPPEYEYPPLVFDLFDFHPECAACFFQGIPPKKRADDCFQALLMHDFGGDYVRLIWERLNGAEPSELRNIFRIREALERFFSGE